jgi:hypothetical protein
VSARITRATRPVFDFFQDILVLKLNSKQTWAVALERQRRLSHNEGIIPTAFFQSEPGRFGPEFT